MGLPRAGSVASIATSAATPAVVRQALVRLIFFITSSLSIPTVRSVQARALHAEQMADTQADTIAEEDEIGIDELVQELQAELSVEDNNSQTHDLPSRQNQHTSLDELAV